MNVATLEPSPTGPPARRTLLVRRLGSQWTNLHLVWKILIVMAVLGILAFPFLGSARQVHRTWNYENDLAAAKSALAAGRDVEARDLSLAVLRGDPKRSEALPIFLHAAEGAADSRLAGVAQGYLSLRTRDKADRLFAWKAICKQRPMGVAGGNWLTIRDDEKADPDFLIPWLERLLSENLSQSVEIEIAAQANQADPRLERIRLSMLAKRGTEDSYRELQARLLDRMASHPDDGPLLLGALDEIPQAALIPYFFTALGEWIQLRGGEPSVEDQLRLARCEIAAHPETKEAVLTRTMTAHAVTAPLAVARLFSTLDRFDKAEELLEPLVAKGESGAFQLMAEVLERLDKLEKWDKLLEAPPAESFLPGILCDRAFIAAKRGDVRAQPKFEQEAVAAAELRLKSDSLILLARHASRRGLHTYASGIWVKAIRRGPTSPLPLFSSISPVIEVIVRNRNETELMDVLTVYRAVEPGNRDVFTQSLYLGCLIGNVTPARVLAELAPIREKFHSLPLDCTLAFANVLEGNYPLAAQLTHDRSVDWFAQIPAMRAIRAIILTKTGGKEEAEIYLEGFPWDSLLPSETRVFRELLDEPAGQEQSDTAAKTEKAEKGRQVEQAREAVKSKELKAVREALDAKEAGKSEETRNAEKAGRAERIEKARLAEQARQATRAKEAKAAREAREAKARETGETTPP